MTHLTHKKSYKIIDVYACVMNISSVSNYKFFINNIKRQIEELKE
jgi:hypothetical protein